MWHIFEENAKIMLLLWHYSWIWDVIKLFIGCTWQFCFQKFVRMFNLVVNMFLYFSRVNLYKQSGYFWLQMHQVCFQSYHASLVRSHCTQTTYEGRALELARLFSSIFTTDCKICFFIKSSYILARCTVKGYFWISTKFGYLSCRKKYHWPAEDRIFLPYLPSTRKCFTACSSPSWFVKDATGLWRRGYYTAEG